MRHYIVLDLEWNQSTAGKEASVDHLPFEIFEIGAVKLNKKFEKVSEFHRLILPTVYKEMHYIISEVTHATMEELQAQGEPFREDDYSQAILSVQYSMNQYDPAVIGYEWDDDSPRIQLEPRGERGYIELRAIKALNVHCQSDRIK